jgi:hypothetical protein
MWSFITVQEFDRLVARIKVTPLIEYTAPRAQLTPQSLKSGPERLTGLCKDRTQADETRSALFAFLTIHVRFLPIDSRCC